MLSGRSSVDNLQDLYKLISDKVDIFKDSDLPYALARISNLSLWDEYLDQDDVPYPAKYMDIVDLTIFIVELSASIHELFANEIFAQLRDQSKFIKSIGSARIAHMVADKRIRPSDITPGFGGLDKVSWADYGTVIIEVGLSQSWDSCTG
jgi:hypothetical protein